MPIGRSLGVWSARRSGVAAPAWTPSSLTPLEWYRMDLANLTYSPNVSAVADLSGNGRHGSQVTIGEQATTGVIAGLNNAPCIVCNNSGLILPTYSLPTPCTIFIAGEVSAAPGQYGWFYCSDGIYGVQNGKLGAYNCTQAAQPVIGTAPVAVVALYYVDSYTEGGLRVRVGGTTYTSTGVLGQVGVYSLGYRPGVPAQCMSNKIAEVCVSPGTLTGSPLTSLSNYALARYGKTF